MGFVDALKEVGKFALDVGKSMLDTASEFKEEIDKQKKNFETKKDEELLEIYIRYKTKPKGIAAFQLLKDRGYTSDEIKMASQA